MSESVFDVVAEYEEEEHISQQMSYAPVHEYRCYQRNIYGYRGRSEARGAIQLACYGILDRPGIGHNILSGYNLLRNGGIGIGELVVIAKSLKKDEYEDIYS